jgi:hypothetical protein
MAFVITSSAFAEGATVPTQFTCNGNDAPPPINVSDRPKDTRSFAVIMDDPDAPKGTFTHWLAYDIPTGNTELQTGAAKTCATVLVVRGTAAHARRRPRTPLLFLHGVRRRRASLPIAGETRQDLEKALESHTLARARLMGQYERAR